MRCGASGLAVCKKLLRLLVFVKADVQLPGAKVPWAFVVGEVLSVVAHELVGRGSNVAGTLGDVEFGVLVPTGPSAGSRSWGG